MHIRVIVLKVIDNVAQAKKWDSKKRKLNRLLLLV